MSTKAWVTPEWCLLMAQRKNQSQVPLLCEPESNLCVQQKMYQPCCKLREWVDLFHMVKVCVCVFDSVTFHQAVTLSPCQSPRHEHQKELENVWMFLCARCECEAPHVMPGFFGLSRRLFVFVCCCSPVCTFKHAQTHTQTSLLSNLSCPGLLSAIHFPVSQPSIIPACPQMQPSLLKTMRGNDVYRSRRRLRQAKGERGGGGGGFLIKIAIDWDS